MEHRFPALEPFESGMLDPLETPWLLARRWATSRLRVIDDTGHGGDSFLTAVLDALAECAAW